MSYTVMTAKALAFSLLLVMIFCLYRLSLLLRRRRSSAGGSCRRWRRSCVRLHRASSISRSAAGLRRIIAATVTHYSVNSWKLQKN